jgi:hypothetical protein
MKVIAYEATVENGQVKLPEAVHLPDRSRVYVLVPGVEEFRVFHAGSPRLAQPERAGDFTMAVAEEPRDAGLR